MTAETLSPTQCDTSEKIQEVILANHQEPAINDIIYILSEDENTKDELSPEHASQIIYTSFKLGQGMNSFHLPIYDFIHYIRPDWKMSDALKKQTMQKLEPRVGRYLAHSASGSANETDLRAREGAVILHGSIGKKPNMIKEGVSKQLEVFQESLSGKPPENLDEIVKTVAANLMDRDYKYFYRGRIRENVNPNTAAGNTRLSVLAYYGLAHHSIGVPELDELMISVSEWVSNPESGYAKGLNRFIKYHNEAFPVDKVSLLNEN